MLKLFWDSSDPITFDRARWLYFVRVNCNVVLLQPAFVNSVKFFFLSVKKFQSQSSGQYMWGSLSLRDTYNLSQQSHCSILYICKCLAFICIFSNKTLMNIQFFLISFSFNISRDESQAGFLSLFVLRKQEIHWLSTQWSMINSFYVFIMLVKKLHFCHQIFYSCKLLVKWVKLGCRTWWWHCLVSLQSALAPLEQILPQEVPVGRQICAFLLAGHHSGVPQHSHNIIWALQPAPVADRSSGYEQQ